ncbi:dihydrodipicolinate synthase family protein [Desulforhopalus sp. 52FAK]
MGQFKGIIAALITSFDDRGAVFEDGICNQVDYLAQNNIKNIFICGSYGAFPVMTIEQRFQVAEKAIKIAKTNKMKVIVQVGHTSTSSAMQLARHAEGIGADAISAVVPFYYSTTLYNEDVFLEYYESIINSVSIPVHCYNNPNTTGCNISPSFLRKLIEAGLKGIKDGGSEMGRMLEMLTVVEQSDVNFDYYPSSTNSLITGFLLGAESCISGVALTAPDLVNQIYESVKNKDIDRAVKMYGKVMRIRALLGEKSGRAIAAYSVLHAKGVDVGTCKAPWKRLSHSDSNWLVDELQSLGVV